MGWSGNLIGFQNTSTIFEFAWINAPIDNENESIDEIQMVAATTSATEPWKSAELARLANEEHAHYEAQLQSMHEHLYRIKSTITNYVDSNAMEPIDEQFPLQFFNLNSTEADIQSGALKEHIERQRKELEQIFADEKSRIENIKQIMWDCFETKPQKLQGIFTDIFIQNFPLTDLDVKLCDETLVQKVLMIAELFQQICEIKPWIHPNILIKEVIAWPVAAAQPKSHSDRFSVLATKIKDQQLTANVNLDYNFFSTLSTESEMVEISNERRVNEHNIRMHVSEIGWILVCYFNYFLLVFVFSIILCD